MSRQGAQRHQPAAPAPDCAELLALILVELRGLRSDLAAPHHAPRNDDSPAIDRLLEAIASAFGDESFTTGELIERARKSDAELLAAIESTVGGLGSSAAKRLGQLFRTAAKDGRRVKRLGSYTGVALWSMGCLSEPTPEPVLGSRQRPAVADDSYHLEKPE